jgi:hypothetical protein
MATVRPGPYLTEGRHGFEPKSEVSGATRRNEDISSERRIIGMRIAVAFGSRVLWISVSRALGSEFQILLEAWTDDRLSEICAEEMCKNRPIRFAITLCPPDCPHLRF